MPLTARVERGPSEAARSASTKGSLGRSRLFFYARMPRMSALKLVLWAFLAILDAVALAFVVGFVNPQEKVNGLWLVVAAACLFRPARITA